MKTVLQAAEMFVTGGTITNIQEFGNGNINDTYLVTLTGDHQKQFILQRINTAVFRSPELIIHNIRTLSDYVGSMLGSGGEDGVRRWYIPQIQQTITGDYYYLDSQKSFWRGISFIQETRTYDTVQDSSHAHEIGYALGRFHRLVSDMDSTLMVDTLEGFHITPRYLDLYDRVRSTIPGSIDTPVVRFCHEMIQTRRDWADVLEAAKKRAEIKTSIIHGDPKVNNFLICENTGHAVSVIDLDTVKPGVVHYDIGDCARSICNPLGEETTDFDNVTFNLDLAASFLEGYIPAANYFLTSPDYNFIFDAIRLLPFELGLRFFTDYLSGNIYFKVNHCNHNLDRALVQFKLTESIEAQEKEIQDIIKDLQPG